MPTPIPHPRPILAVLAGLMLLTWPPVLAAAVPLGLHTLDSNPTTETVGVFVDSDTAYIATQAGVWAVTDPVVSSTFTPISHPTFGPSTFLTSPMKGPDGDIYVGGRFLDNSFLLQSALFKLPIPSTPETEWPEGQIFSLDDQLNGYGTFRVTNAARLDADGSISMLPHPIGESGGAVLDVSASGIAVGRNERPGSLNGPAIWDNTGISFLDDTINGLVRSVRDNHTGSQNFGAVLEDQAYVKFGGGVLTPLVDEIGAALLADEVYVAETDFAVINKDFDGGVYVYHPGLTETAGQALPIETVFPELVGTSFTAAGRPAASAGRIYLPLSDGAHLLVANDPSVLAGDLNLDGFVGIDDLNLVLGNWNQTVPPGDPLADPSGDGFVGIDDLNAVLGNWNAGTPPNSQANIPEPGTLAILSMTMAGLLRPIRHRAQPSTSLTAG